MSQKIIHTHRGTVIVISDNVVTVIPVKRPIAATEGTGGSPSTADPPPAPDPKPQPQVEPEPEFDPKVWPRPKDGPGVMIVSPYGGMKDRFPDLFSPDSKNVEHLYIDLNAMPPFLDWDALRDRVRYTGSSHAPSYTVLDVRMAAAAIKKGIDTAAFEKLFAPDSGPEIHGIRIASTDWSHES